jgi:hypothetical protein
MEKEAEGGKVSADDILREVRQLQLQLNVTPEYKFYIAICGVFGPHRSIVKRWENFEEVFTNLIEQDEELGLQHFFQAVIQFFINRHPEKQNLAATFCKKLYDRGIIEDTFFTSWHGKQMKLDRDCKLYDRPAESAMRRLLDEFVQWMQSADYGEEKGDEYGDEAYGAEEEKKEEEAPQETEAQKNQRLLIEAQKRAQAEQLEAAKEAGAKKKEAAAAAQEESK